MDSSNKMRLYDECKFTGVGFNEAHEHGECSMAHQIIPLCKNVLEIGGGAGKVSHAINTLLSKRNLETKHVVVEPGSIGLGNHGDVNIYENKKNFNDKYTIIKKLCEDLTMDDLHVLEGPPDCLYTDCEGCLHKFFTTDIGKYVLDNVRFIVNEMDGMILKIDDATIVELWKKNGFVLVGSGYGCGTDCETQVWYRQN
uniref:Methyltransferase n=1 Tax=viral metagenome TaxID=1070528 RepID=A0A6C0I9W9_9ZZZZ